MALDPIFANIEETVKGLGSKFNSTPGNIHTKANYMAILQSEFRKIPENYQTDFLLKSVDDLKQLKEKRFSDKPGGK